MPGKVSRHKDHLGTTYIVATELSLSLDVLCLYVLAGVLLGIVIVCRNDARSVIGGLLRSKESGIISVDNVITIVAILLILLNTRNLILHLLCTLLLSLIVLIASSLL
jgi:hypothetical protein